MQRSPVDSVISVHVGDEVEAAYEEAQRRGFEIVHPLTTEPWGVRRFLVRAPDGNVVNIVNHKEEDAVNSRKPRSKHYPIDGLYSTEPGRDALEGGIHAAPCRWLALGSPVQHGAAGTDGRGLSPHLVWYLVISQ